MRWRRGGRCRSRRWRLGLLLDRLVFICILASLGFFGLLSLASLSGLVVRDNLADIIFGWCRRPGGWSRYRRGTAASVYLRFNGNGTDKPLHASVCADPRRPALRITEVALACVQKVFSLDRRQDSLCRTLAYVAWLGCPRLLRACELGVAKQRLAHPFIVDILERGCRGHRGSTDRTTRAAGLAAEVLPLAFEGDSLVSTWRTTRKERADAAKGPKDRFGAEGGRWLGQPRLANFLMGCISLLHCGHLAADPESAPPPPRRRMRSTVCPIHPLARSHQVDSCNPLIALVALYPHLCVSSPQNTARWSSPVATPAARRIPS